MGRDWVAPRHERGNPFEVTFISATLLFSPWQTIGRRGKWMWEFYRQYYIQACRWGSVEQKQILWSPSKCDGVQSHFSRNSEDELIQFTINLIKTQNEEFGHKGLG